MQLDLYKKVFNSYFNSQNTLDDIDKSVRLILTSRRIFFIGNGGSNAICSHMMEDYAKIGSFQTFCFSDAALITCFANDYGYENAMAEWLKIHIEKNDILIAISSSGNSKNILNAVDVAKNKNAGIVTLSGFKADNKLKDKGSVNFFIDTENYGIVECFHQVILHAILDEIALQKKK